VSGVEHIAALTRGEIYPISNNDIEFLRLINTNKNYIESILNFVSVFGLNNLTLLVTDVFTTGINKSISLIQIKEKLVSGIGTSINGTIDPTSTSNVMPVNPVNYLNDSISDLLYQLNVITPSKITNALNITNLYGIGIVSILVDIINSTTIANTYTLINSAFNIRDSLTKSPLYQNKDKQTLIDAIKIFAAISTTDRAKLLSHKSKFEPSTILNVTFNLPLRLKRYVTRKALHLVVEDGQYEMLENLIDGIDASTLIIPKHERIALISKLLQFYKSRKDVLLLGEDKVASDLIRVINKVLPDWLVTDYQTNHLTDDIVKDLNHVNVEQGNEFVTVKKRLNHVYDLDLWTNANAHTLELLLNNPATINSVTAQLFLNTLNF
jgi:hypothetical protein